MRQAVRLGGLPADARARARFTSVILSPHALRFVRRSLCFTDEETAAEKS